MKVILLVLFIIAPSILFSEVSNTIQEGRCSKDFVFYKIILDKIARDKKKPVLVKFDYQMSSSLEKSFTESNKIAKEIIRLMKESSLHQNKQVFCQKIKNLVVEMGALNQPPNIGEAYRSINLSKSIIVNDKAAYVFVEVLSTVSGGYVQGGGVVLQIFAKKCDAWFLEETKILEQY